LTYETGSGFIEVAGQRLHFLQFGSGPALVLAFPGYGMTAAAFSFLAQESFTVLSFDLPYSGNTVCEADFVFTKEQIGRMIEALLQQRGLKRLSLAGFSIGGRICLSALESVPDLISSVVVAAPDGTGKEWFYRFVTGTSPGRLLFKRFVQYGERYIRVLQLLHFIRLLPNHKFRFIVQYIGTPEARAKVRNIWMSLAQLLPNRRQVASMASSKKIPVHILAGNTDTVIPLRNLRRFAARSSYISLHLFERGHNLLQFDEVKGMFASRLRKP
jgi:pimeloyl-ACP methyl ester carboxylesterase